MPQNDNPIWPEDRVRLLKLLHAQGNSASLIAAELGCTRNAVIGKLGRLGISGRKSSARLPRAGHRRPSPPPQQLAPVEHSNWQRDPKKDRGLTHAAPLYVPSPPPPTAPVGEPVTFEALGPHHCRNVLDQRGGEFNLPMYCGKRRAYGWYCADCAPGFYTPVGLRRAG